MGCEEARGCIGGVTRVPRPAAHPACQAVAASVFSL